MVVVPILARLGLATAQLLARVRKYVFLALTVLTAVLWPPDVILMLIFLVSLYTLYVLAILLNRIAAPKNAQVRLSFAQTAIPDRRRE